MSATTDALVFVGKGLASGALSKIGGDAMGFVLDQIFGGTGDTAAIAKLGDQLNQIEGMIQELLNELRDDFKTIEKQLADIKQQELYTAWELRDNSAQEKIANINTQYTTYVEFAQNPKTTSKASISRLTTEILDTNVGAANNRQQLNMMVTGFGQDKGLLQLWQEMVSPLIAADKMTFYDAIDNYMDYYATIVYAQMRATVLLVEAYNQKRNQPLAKQSWEDYRKFVDQQELCFVTYFDVFAASELSKFHKGTFCPTPGWNDLTFAALDARQSFYAGSTYGWHQPTSQHQRAEALLADAQSMGPDERRIVVWMVYPRDWPYGSPPPKPVTNFDQINISITSVDQSAVGEIKPLRSDVIRVPTSADHTIKRFLFSPPSDGAYVLKDMNGTPGLPDMPGYGTKTSYFQDPTYLAFKMSVSPNKQFDFTEFTPYADVYQYMLWHAYNLPG
jgi:hypothetical protein